MSVEWRTKPHGVPLLPCAHSTRRPLRTFGSHEVAVALRSSAERHAVAGREGEDLRVACGGALMWSVECHCRSQPVEMCSEALACRGFQCAGIREGVQQRWCRWWFPKPAVALCCSGIADAVC